MQSIRLNPDYLAPNGTLYPIHSVTTDIYGNVTESWSTQTFVVLAGQAKLASGVTFSPNDFEVGDGTVASDFELLSTSGSTGTISTTKLVIKGGTSAASELTVVSNGKMVTE